jgi:hypothetical protein
VKLAQSTEASIKGRKVKPVSGKLKDLSGAEKTFPLTGDRFDELACSGRPRQALGPRRLA